MAAAVAADIDSIVKAEFAHVATVNFMHTWSLFVRK